MNQSADTTAVLHTAHLRELGGRYAVALQAAGVDTLIIDAGRSSFYFRDDQGSPFRPNPYFSQWLPLAEAEHCALIVRPGERPRLLYFQPQDYWHQAPQDPSGYWVDSVDIEVFADVEALTRRALALAQGRVGYLGPQPQFFGNLAPQGANPASLLAYLDYHRAEKTDFEIACLRAATLRAAKGHLAARQAFEEGLSEFAIHLRYLAASDQTEQELPYGNIIALNEHGSVLHYQPKERQSPAEVRSFLIDAGATHDHYIADVTRTYAKKDGAFAELINTMDRLQQQIIAHIRVGMPYLKLHEFAHHCVGIALQENKLVRCSADAAFSSGITRSFLPHGLGHLLGLQTHDAGGHLADASGTSAPPPAIYPALRNTRTIEPRHVFTIEPGLYFIPMLLRELRGSALTNEINWPRVEAMVPYGGIRIEDNVVVGAKAMENLTRDAFQQLGA